MRIFKFFNERVWQTEISHRLLSDVPTLVRLFKINFLIVSTWFLLQPIIYTNDSETYIAAAKKMLGGKYDLLYFRTEGYPLFLIFTGGVFNTFYGVLTAQFIIALLIPFVVYKIMLHISKELALSAAVLTICSSFSFACSKFIMTQHLYFFVQLFFLYSAALYIKSERPKYYFSLLISGVGLYLIRPSAEYLPFLALVFFFFIGLKKDVRAQIKRALMGLGFLIGIYFLHSIYHGYVASEIAPSWKSEGSSQASSKGGHHMLGKSLFSQIYIAGDYYYPDGIIHASNGPATEKIINSYNLFYKENPDKIEAVFGNKGNHDIKWVLGHKDGLSHYVLWMVMDSVYDPKEADKVFLHASIEALMMYPSFLKHYFLCAAHFLFGEDIITHYGAPIYQLPQLFDFQDAPSHPRLQKELDRSPVTAFHKKYYKISSYYYLFVKIVIFCSVLISSVLLFRRKLTDRQAVFFLFCCLCWVYEVLTICVFAAPRFYYYVFSFFPLLFCGSFALSILPNYEGKSR